MAPEVVVQAGRAAELAIDVRELAPCVAQEQPSGDEVVRAQQVDEDEYDADHDMQAVRPEDGGLVWRQKAQFGGQPGREDECGEAGEERSVGDYRFASSNAWSTRKYVTCKPSGLTRTNSFGTWSRNTKSICAT